MPTRSNLVRLAVGFGTTAVALLAFTAVSLTADQATQTVADAPAVAAPKGMPALRTLADNPLTQPKIDLGKQLFFDTRLSRDNTVSCATCHDPAKGWSNGDAVATGVRGQKGGRSAPTILNAGYHQHQFWDGRASELEGQALGPIQNPIEMDLTLPELVEKLSKVEGYKKQFKDVFGADISSDNIAKAIAAFERTIVSGDAPYDRFKAGDNKALSEAAQRGMNVFFNKAQCSSCHVGPHFSDGAFHNIGIGMDHATPDEGRRSISKLEGDRGAFKTPTLREIGRTGPYMHDGRFKTLEEVIEYYDKGGTPNPQLAEEIFALSLTAEQRADLVTFLKEGLASSSYPEVKAPELPK